jgi:hypothetical protein
MKHKWHREIKAWADGAEIEFLTEDGWFNAGDPEWNENSEYRIKPQPKELQYLYVWGKGMGIEFTICELKDRTLIGKIKLEVDDV